MNILTILPVFWLLGIMLQETIRKIEKYVKQSISYIQFTSKT